MSAAKTEASGTLTGIALVLCGWAAFSAQDAIVKWLVVKLPVAEVLFARSLTIVVIASFAVRRADLTAMMGRRNLAGIGARAVLILAGLAFGYYIAVALVLQLAELVTLYFAAPLFVVAMSNPVLGEIVGPWRWLAAIVGVLPACSSPANFSTARRTSGPPCSRCSQLCPGLARRCWLAALSQSGQHGGADAQQQFPLHGRLRAQRRGSSSSSGPIRSAPALMFVLGLIGSIGQFFLFEGLRRAPAAFGHGALLEYSALAWAILWGWLIFGDLPTRNVLIGAAIILASGVMMLVVESRRRSCRGAG